MTVGMGDDVPVCVSFSERRRYHYPMTAQALVID